jgi:hypothetical protein
MRTFFILLWQTMVGREIESDKREKGKRKFKMQLTGELSM